MAHLRGEGSQARHQQTASHETIEFLFLAVLDVRVLISFADNDMIITLYTNAQ